MITSFQCIYKDENSLKKFIKENDLDLFPSLLVQAFTGHSSIDFITSLQKEVAASLPRATLIGCSSNGQIFEGRVLSEVILTFTAFEKTELNSFLVDGGHQGKMDGEQLYDELIRYDTKAVILLVSHLKMDIPGILQGVSPRNDEFKIVGGVCADDPANRPSIVFTGDEISQSGLAAVSLNHSDLHVHSYALEHWQEVGPSFEITKSEGNVIYKINDKKPLHVLERYLGKSFVKELPDSSIEFPFLYQHGNEKTAVYVINILPQGAIEVSREMDEGDRVNFGFVNVQELLESTAKQLNKLKRSPVETHYVFNCIARKRYIRDFTTQELAKLNEISAVTGFFSYGEFGYDSSNKPKLIAHSMTYLGISEEVREPLQDFKPEFHLAPEANAMMTLTNLINTASSDIRELTQNIEVSEEYYRSLFDNNTDFVYSTDLKGRFTSLNPSFIKTFGYSESELIGRNALNYIMHVDRQRVRRHFYRAMDGREQYYDLPISTKDGRINHFQIKNIPITVNGQCVGIFGIGKDVTQQRQSEKKITQLAYFDGDTDLPNKQKFREIIDEHIQRAKKKKRELAVLFMDIDRFKIINDTLGHRAGDLVIKELAGRLGGALPKGAYLGRFSGDKFTVLLSKNVNEESISSLTDAILKTIKEPFSYNGKDFYMTVSIGVGIFPRDGDKSSEVLRNADAALNHAKSRGGNNTVYFSRDMNEETLRKVEMEAQLRKAIAKNDLYIAYQPIIDVPNETLIGCEALLRWEHEEMGSVSPAEFIPLAEEAGLIQELGKWVLTGACEQLKTWMDTRLGKFYVSVNVSAIQFQHPAFVSDVKEALKVSGLPPEYLCLELTETIMLHDESYSVEVMRELSQLGIKLAIDDFGTGYSSLSYLKHLPIDILKIDRSFVRNMSDHSPDVAIVQSVSMMGRGLNLKVVAEGVETTQQLKLLKGLGCDYAQGFLIEKPMPPCKMGEFLMKQDLAAVQGS
ncbi:diguanylate cyclase [[Bacillus] enclensis]|uniref:PAS domain S-box-containing protein/diguanylate cyclase (GGDEF) domain-containing protein n=1 Tax=[Bacillus] enclensis TaxID=1402860 RepID=A0A0V8HHZ3_9BACI|nr:EAL domain-containing protein [[Bacillus] enclensis]KSU62188.1 diguanylate cyclase [[Bacillus] enclensis]SCC00566.1 PAS domain S-box-containing protein/diguanylate cyclase (GGDEF) domain-containing protein [[Bacillus] enclensis]